MSKSAAQHLTIRVRYRTEGSKRSKTLSLREEQYFDPEYMLSGRDRICSVPLYQEAWRYVQEQSQVVATTVMLVDTRFKQRRTITTSYWNRMESQLTEVRESGVRDKLEHRELISSQKFSIAGKSGWLIERWQWSGGRWAPASCAFVEQLPDGSQRDHPIDVTG